MRTCIYQTLQPKNKLILDRIDSIAKSAYSLRRLTKSYSGSLIRVRRSNDSAELDIGFDRNNRLDLTLLLGFVTTNTGYITKVYSQYGTNHLVQPTLNQQPTIVRNGILDTKNGKPCIHQQASLRQVLTNSAGEFSSNNFSIIYTAALDGTTNNRILSGSPNWLLGFWPNEQRCVYQNTSGAYSSGITATTNTQCYSTIGRGAGNLASLYRNGIDFTIAGNALSSAPSQLYTTSTGYDNTEFSDCIIHEIITFDRQISDSNRSAIEQYQISSYVN